VAATGTGTLSYQWYRGSTPIPGATSASYTTPATVATDNGALFSVAVTNSGVSVVSKQVTLTVTGGTCTAAPSTPGTLSATTMSGTSIGLTWVASTAEATCPVSYDIFRSTTAGFTASSTNQIGMAQPGTTYTDTGLTAGTTYYYIVDALDSSGTSGPSNQATAMTPAAGAPAPDFMLSVTPNAVTVAAGGNGMTTVNVEPQNGFSTSSLVTFTCSGLPAGATCNFSPVTVSSSGAMSSTLTINAAVAGTAMKVAGAGMALSGSSLGLLLLVRRRKERQGRLMTLLPLVVLVLTVFVGCSKSSTTTQSSTGAPSSGSGTPTTTTVTVTATAGSVMHAATFSLTVTAQ
jgi:fibronectin type 3 domain-containing protein